MKKNHEDMNQQETGLETPSLFNLGRSTGLSPPVWGPASWPLTMHLSSPGGRFAVEGEGLCKRFCPRELRGLGQGHWEERRRKSMRRRDLRFYIWGNTHSTSSLNSEWKKTVG